MLNTSIGWHLASGRWMLEHREILRFNPFTFTANGAPWLDHEWLFQVIAATAEAASGAQALVLMRVVVIIGLAFVLLQISRRAGLAPAPALLLVALCVAGARFRFYVRPELATLILTPLAVHCYLTRNDRKLVRSVLAITAVTALGINLHGGILILPVILTVLLAAEIVGDALARRALRPHITSGVTMLGAVIAGTLVNPWGFHVFAAPIRLARLVSKDFIPNPEWISPGPTDVPELFIAIVAAGLILALRGRDPVRWALYLIATALALRYVRNVGLFFVLLPEAIGPSLARFAPFHNNTTHLRRACLAATAILAALMIDARGFPLGFGYSTERYPVAACAFLERNDLLSKPLYNDVRFGGWLIGRYYPPTQAFIDDRNEIHEEVLEEIWSIETSSSVARWQAFLDGYGIATALLRYHDPLIVTTPQGEDLGSRGYSALWFPSDTWALVHWDDTAMVLVNRHLTDPRWTAVHEYRWLRPDDLDHLGSSPKVRPRPDAVLSRSSHAGFARILHAREPD